MRALVTGGRGGIGRAIVDCLVGRGYDVVAADVAAADVTRPGAVSPICDDLTDESALREMVRYAGAGGLHVLVNCAGISPKIDGAAPQIPDISLDEWDRVFAVNVRSAS